MTAPTTQALPQSMHRQALAELDRLLVQWLNGDHSPDDLPCGLQRGIVGVLEEFSNGETPAEFLDFDLSVEELRQEWNSFQAAMNAAEYGRTVKPSAYFLSTLRVVMSHIRTGLTPLPRKLPDPLAEFSKTVALPGVNDWQLAKTFGITSDGTRTGQPDLLKLEEAKRDPAAFFGEGWRWPSERAAEANEQKRQAEFLALQPLWQVRIDELEKQQAVVSTPVAQKTPRPTESIETLLAMKSMRGDQICKMKKITHAELEQYCLEHDLAYPGCGYLS